MANWCCTPKPVAEAADNADSYDDSTFCDRVGELFADEDDYVEAAAFGLTTDNGHLMMPPKKNEKSQKLPKTNHSETKKTPSPIPAVAGNAVQNTTLPQIEQSSGAFSGLSLPLRPVPIVPVQPIQPVPIVPVQPVQPVLIVPEVPADTVANPATILTPSAPQPVQIETPVASAPAPQAAATLPHAAKPSKSMDTSHFFRELLELRESEEERIKALPSGSVEQQEALDRFNVDFPTGKSQTFSDVLRVLDFYKKKAAAPAPKTLDSGSVPTTATTAAATTSSTTTTPLAAAATTATHVPEEVLHKMVDDINRKYEPLLKEFDELVCGEDARINAMPNSPLKEQERAQFDLYFKPGQSKTARDIEIAVNKYRQVRQDRAAAAAAAAAERERLERERLELVRREHERLQQQKMEQERIQQEKLEAERTLAASSSKEELQQPTPPVIASSPSPEKKKKKQQRPKPITKKQPSSEKLPLEPAEEATESTSSTLSDSLPPPAVAEFKPAEKKETIVPVVEIPAVEQVNSSQTARQARPRRPKASSEDIAPTTSLPKAVKETRVTSKEATVNKTVTVEFLTSVLQNNSLNGSDDKPKLSKDKWKTYNACRSMLRNVADGQLTPELLKMKNTDIARSQWQSENDIWRNKNQHTTLK